VAVLCYPPKPFYSTLSYFWVVSPLLLFFPEIQSLCLVLDWSWLWFAILSHFFSLRLFHFIFYLFVRLFAVHVIITCFIINPRYKVPKLQFISIFVTTTSTHFYSRPSLHPSLRATLSSNQWEIWKAWHDRHYSVLLESSLANY